MYAVSNIHDDSIYLGNYKSHTFLPERNIIISVKYDAMPHMAAVTINGLIMYCQLFTGFNRLVVILDSLVKEIL